MNHGDGESVRWRGSVLAVTIIIVLALVGEALVPAFATASPRPSGGSPVSWAEDYQNKDGKKERSKRRRGVNSQIVGGKLVPQGKFTFMAFVETDLFACGGSLIHPLYVLTAAHCVEDFDEILLDPESFSVSIGKANLDELGPENERGVVEVFQHPDWNPNTFENDMAVLELDEPVFGSIAQLLPMVSSNETRFDGTGQLSVVAGWGVTAEVDAPTSDRLLEADLRIVSDAGCDAAYQEFDPPFVQSVMICAALQGRDSCQGDSGGPLMAKEVTGFKVKKGKKKKHKKRKKKKIPIFEVTQMGIVSFGNGCAQPGFPGVYTRLSAPGINDFIVETMSN